MFSSIIYKVSTHVCKHSAFSKNKKLNLFILILLTYIINITEFSDIVQEKIFIYPFPYIVQKLVKKRYKGIAHQGVIHGN